MGTSVERRRRKKHKYEKLENISKTLLYSLLGSDVSRRSRKRSRSSSSLESRKTSRHRHRKSRSRREERKSRKFDRDIKQEKLDTSNEVSEISVAPWKNTEIEVIDIDEIPLPESPRIVFKPKEEPFGRPQNDPKSMEIDENEAAPDASQETNELPVATQSVENPENSDQTSQIPQNKPEEESVATVCSKLVETWQSILHQGLSSQANEELLKKYRLTYDAHSFKAPTLNTPIKSLLSGANIVRDEMEMAKQDQFGALLSAIEKGIYLIVKSEKRCKGLAKVIETMNDAASFIAQLHYSVSLQRRIRVAEEIGVVKMEIAANVAERLFSEEEEKEMQERVTELIELSFIDEEIEKRLAAAKEEENNRKAQEAKRIAEENAKKMAEEEAKKMAEQEAKKMAEEEAKKMAEESAAAEQPSQEQEEEEEEEEEEDETPCSQRFSTTRHCGRTFFKAETEGVKAVKSEGKIKSEKRALPKFVPNSEFPGIETVMRMAIEKRGLPKKAIPITLNGINKNTWTSYAKPIKSWWDFSHRESCDTFDPKVADVIGFLVECYDNGMSLSALKTARAALSRLVSKDLGKNEDISELYQGFAKKA